MLEEFDSRRNHNELAQKTLRTCASTSGRDAVTGMNDISLVLVAAVADNGVIGRDGGLPWRLKSDLQHFRALTLGHPVLMGRRTFASIGRPLPGRTNIVVSRDRAFAAPGVLVGACLEDALEAARGDALRRGVETVMVIGGADIYAQAMPLASRLEITRVRARPTGDTVFPTIAEGEWRETARRDGLAGPEDEATFTFVSYERVAGGTHDHASLGGKAAR
jgi:dihydrofolate reductase